MIEVDILIAKKRTSNTELCFIQGDNNRVWERTETETNFTFISRQIKY